METKKVVRPTRVAHIGIQATDVSKTRDWYCRLLNGEVAFEKIPYFSFVTFDDEHHRFAISALPGKPQERAPSAPAISHAAAR